MQLRREMKTWAMIALVTGVFSASRGASGQASPEVPGRLCTGSYSDDFTALSAQARDFDAHPEAAFSYCTRNTAVYECLSYAPDGAVKRVRKKVMLHGTAFAYKRQGTDVLLLTNDHVATWPAVTDPQHAVEDVPTGCKKVSETLALVDDEYDRYARDDIALTRVVSDPQLDVAVLKAHADLHVMSWKVGHSNALRERNLVEVRGFPLGAFQATNLGKVISTHDHDDYGDWEHDDFVVDALLSAGNSGSPVLAISCATGEYELVGIYHAGYTAGSALNVVVGIDQVRDLMTTLKRSPRSHDDDPITVDSNTRATIRAALGADEDLFFPVGTQVAQVKAASAGRLLFGVFAKEFPMTAEPALVLEDLPAPGSGFGAIGRVWFGSQRGLKSYDHAELDADAAAQVSRLLEALRADAAQALAYRAVREQDTRSRQSDDRTHRMAAELARAAASGADLLQAVMEQGDRLGPQAGDAGVRFASLMTPPAPAPPPAAASTATSITASGR
jgi:Trypsin-like peptidase domain